MVPTKEYLNSLFYRVVHLHPAYFLKGPFVPLVDAMFVSIAMSQNGSVAGFVQLKEIVKSPNHPPPFLVSYIYHRLCR